MSLPVPRTLAGCKPRTYTPEYRKVRAELSKLGLRRCLTCGELLEVSAFYRNPRGESADCKLCTVERARRNKLLRSL